VPLFRSNPLDELVLPDGTHVEEHDLVTEGDGDCRLDMWCEVDSDVLVGEDAYLGERVHVGGELKVAGDLDIGDDVDIDDGFEAAGWIVIRNPMPTITFLFVYLSQLLRIGEEEAAEEMLETLVSEDREHQPLVVPRGARVGDDAWQVSTPARIGDGCRLHGNVRAESMVVGRDNEVFGSLRAREGVTVGAGTEVAGNVTTRNGTVRIGPEAEIRGDVSGDYVEVHHEATVEGAIRAREETSMVSETVLDDAALQAAVGVDHATDDAGDPTPAIRPANRAPARERDDADGDGRRPDATAE